MKNTAIQMDLLSEVRTPQQVLNYAINRERGQANQQEILRANSTSRWNQVTYIRQIRRPQAILHTPNPEKSSHAGNAETHSPQSPTKLPGEKHKMQNLQKTRTLLVHVQSFYAGKKKTTPTKHVKPTIKISKHLHKPPRKQPNQEGTSYKRQHRPNGGAKL